LELIKTTFEELGVDFGPVEGRDKGGKPTLAVFGKPEI
jgi:hypothetical protein